MKSSYGFIDWAMIVSVGFILGFGAFVLAKTIGADVGQPAIQAENSIGKEIRFAVTLNESEFRTLQRIAEERNKRVSIDGLPPITWQAVLHESVVERIQLLVRDQP